MNKYKVVMIIKFLVLCLVLVFSLTAVCQEELEPTNPAYDPTAILDVRMDKMWYVAFLMGWVENLTVDKDTVQAGESYTISWTYDGPYEENRRKRTEDARTDALFFYVGRTTDPDFISRIPTPGYQSVNLEPNTFFFALPDSSSYTFSTSGTKYTTTFYHNVWVTNGLEISLPFTLEFNNYINKSPSPSVTVLAAFTIYLELSEIPKTAREYGLEPGQSYTLSWNRVEGMSGYELVVSEDENFPPEKTTIIFQGDNTSYKALAPEYITGITSCYFRVRAVSDTEASDWSNVVFLKMRFGPLPMLYAPVTEVKVNEPFQLRYFHYSQTPEGWLHEVRNSSDSTAIEIEAPGPQEREITLIEKKPGLYKYTVSTKHFNVIRFSNPVYVTVVSDIQPVTLSVSSSEASYLEDYSFSWNSAGDVDGYYWQECAGDTAKSLVNRVFPSQVLSWVCAHRVARDSLFMYRVRSFFLNSNASPDTLFHAWSPAVQVTVHPLQPPFGLAFTEPGPTYGMTSEINWPAVPHADRYRIEMTSGGSVIFLDSEATQISHKFLSLAELTIRAQSISGTDTSAWSAPIAVTVNPPVPPVATLSSNQVESGESYTLDWTIAITEGLQKFIIEENIGGSSSELEIQPEERSRTFSHETQSALTCTYRIKARYLIEGATFDTDWSAPVSIAINPLIITPEAPVATISKSEIQSGESVTISWNAVANSTVYELKNITAGTTTRVSGTSKTVRLVNNQQSTITYQFTVTAVNESGGQVARSSQSNTVSVEVSPAPAGPVTPDAPVLSVSPGEIQSGESVTFSWNAVANATSYELNNITEGTTTSVSGTSKTVTLVNNQQDTKLYQFTVTAVNESGGQVARSSQSNTVSVEVFPVPPLVTPDAPVLSVSLGEIQSGESETFSWNAVANATSYELNNITDVTTTSVSGTSITVTLYNVNPIESKLYEFTVTAVNESGGQVARSSQSNTVYVEVHP